MRAVQYDTEAEAIEQHNELEALLVDLHDLNTTKYACIEQGAILILQEVDKYEPIVSEWIQGKETFDYITPKQEEEF